MRILFLTHNYSPEVNAAATRVSERAKYWADKGHQITVITCNPHFPQGRLYPGYSNKWYQKEYLDGIYVIRVKTYIVSNAGVIKRTISFIVYMLMAILVGLMQKKPDVVISTSPQFFTAIGGWVISAIKRRPFVFELGDIWPASLSAVGVMKKSFFLSCIEKIELFLYRHSAKVIALTTAFKNNLVSRGINPDKVEVVLNGVDLSKYSPREKNNELLKNYELKDSFVIGYIGTHGMAHALENVIAAAKLLQDTSAKFMFVGDGASRQHLIEMAQKEQLKNVLFIPAQPKNRMADFWSICDLALVHLKNDPVFQEVIPSKIFEAMGMGLPILLAAPQGEASHIIESTGVGIVIPSEEPVALMEAIKSLIGEPSKLKEYAEKSAKAAYLYTREKQANDVLSVIESVVK